MRKPKALEKMCEGFGQCPPEVSTAVMKQHDQKELGRKGLVWLTLPHCSPSLKTVRTGAQPGQGPEAEGDAESVEKFAPHGSPSLLSYRIQDAAQGWDRLQWAGPAHTDQELRKCLTAGSGGGIFLSEISSSDDFSLCQVNINYPAQPVYERKR